MKNIMNLKTTMRLVILCLCAATSFTQVASAQIAGGGNYTLTQTSIASGGASGAGASTNGNYSIEGIIGQATAGTKQTNASYTFAPGFWTAQPIFAPTASAVSVGGRVMSAAGRGIRNVMIKMTDGSGAVRVAYSTAFGYYRFADVPAGETYIFTVKGKRFEFAQPTQVVSILEDTLEINFMAVPLQ